jgi:hypothetical protein
VNQNIDTGGGDFDQNIDIDPTIASGDGAVAAGDDIEDSNVVTGDGNVVGEDNVVGNEGIVGDNNQAVIGDDNNTSFGEGDANSAEIDGNVDVGSGGAFSVGGDASGNDADTNIQDSFNTTEDNDTTTTTEFQDSFNQDNDSSSEYSDDDTTTTTTDSHDYVESHASSHNQIDADA